MTAVGSDPLYMLTGVIPATEKVLARSGLSLSDIDLFEVNEAFAPVVLAWAADTGADLAKTNVNGGANVTLQNGGVINLGQDVSIPTSTVTITDSKVINSGLTISFSMVLAANPLVPC